MQPQLPGFDPISQINLERSDRALPAHAGADSNGRLQVFRVVCHGTGIHEHSVFPLGRQAALTDRPLPFNASHREVTAGADNTTCKRDADVTVAIAAHGVVAAGAKQLAAGHPRLFGRGDSAKLGPGRDAAAGKWLPLPAVRYDARDGVLHLLVVGGSLGAKTLNETVPAALALIPQAMRPRVTHQSGKQHVDALRAAYAAAGVDAEVLAFIDDMPRRYADADLVLCRAGAITVSELTAAGIASILVPLVASTTTHQRDNATWMAAMQAAIHLPQTELTPARLAKQLQDLTRAACKTMAQAAYENGRRDANEAIATILEKLAGVTDTPQPAKQVP